MFPGPGDVVGLALLLLGGALLLESRKRRAESRAVGQAAAALAATHQGRSLHGEHAGTRYRCWYTPASRHTTPSVTVAIATPVPGGFSVGRERATHRLWKRLHLTREIATGDAAFDHDFYVITEVPAFAAAVLSQPEAREAVAGLFQLRCSEVSHVEDMVQAEWLHVGATAVDPPLLRLAVSYLAALGHAIARVPGQRPAAVSVNPGRTFLGALPVALGIAGLVGLATGEGVALLDAGDLFVASLRWSVPALALYLLVTVKVLARRSTSHRELAAFALLALAAFPLAGFSAARYINVELDQSVPRSHAVRIVQKYRSGGRAGTQSFGVEVNSWRGAGRERVPLSQPDWERLASSGSRLTVVTRAGRLGFEWIEAYRPDS